MDTTLTATKERPILFSGPMVRAVLADGKTQTRRVARPQFTEWTTTSEGELWPAVPVNNITSLMHCPYGQPGDRLWVRETFHKTKGAQRWADGTIIYRADHGADIGGLYVDLATWRPSIFMPRAASRITLEVTGVRVERVQDISDLDAIAEGIQFVTHEPIVENGLDMLSPSDEFSVLWDSINAKRGYGWDVNPWVWVVEFKRL